MVFEREARVSIRARSARISSSFLIQTFSWFDLYLLKKSTANFLNEFHNIYFYFLNTYMLPAYSLRLMLMSFMMLRMRSAFSWEIGIGRKGGVVFLLEVVFFNLGSSDDDDDDISVFVFVDTFVFVFVDTFAFVDIFVIAMHLA